jgi:hypothetical protein
LDSFRGQEIGKFYKFIFLESFINLFFWKVFEAINWTVLEVRKLESFWKVFEARNWTVLEVRKLDSFRGQEIGKFYKFIFLKVL